MKKGLLIILAAALCFAAYLFFFNGKEAGSIDKEKPLALAQSSSGYASSVQSVLEQYYKMHDALVDWKTAATIDSIGDSLALYASQIRFDDLKADTLLVNTAKNYASAIIAECNAMKSDTAISEQRKSFYTISENLYDLLRTTQYNKTTIYHILCPMAFNGDEEAYWISDKKEIINPFYGNKDPKHGSTMLHCGSVEDSISFK